MALPPLQSLQRRDEPTGQQKKYRCDGQIDEIHWNTPQSTAKEMLFTICPSLLVRIQSNAQKVKMV
jgi:hypothetical protein